MFVVGCLVLCCSKYLFERACQCGFGRGLPGASTAPCSVFGLLHFLHHRAEQHMIVEARSWRTHYREWHLATSLLENHILVNVISIFDRAYSMHQIVFKISLGTLDWDELPFA